MALAFIWIIFTSHQQPSAQISSKVEAKVPIDSLFSLAVQLKATLKCDSAALLFQRIAPVYQKHHQWEKYLACQANLAFCFWITHRSNQAAILCNEMIEEGGTRLGKEHIQLSEFYTILGNIHADRRSMADHDKCLVYYEKSLEITKNHYGNQHPALAKAYERLGIARYLIDDYTGAIPFYEKALTFLDEPRADNAATYSKINANLGLIYFGMGHFPKALDHFNKAKSFLCETLGQADSRVVKILINIAQAQIQMNDFDNALFTLEEAALLEARVGEQESKIKVYLLGSIGECYQKKGDYSAAITYYTRCLEHWDANKRDDINGMILELSRIGTCFLKLNRIDESLVYFNKTNALLEKYYDQANLNWVDHLINLGLVWQEKGDAAIAMTYFERALLIAVEKLGKNHPKIGKIQLELAQLLLEKNKLDKSYEWVLKAEQALLLENDPSFDFPPTEEVSDLSAYIDMLELKGVIKTQQFERSGDLSDLQMAKVAFDQGLVYSESLKKSLQSGSAMQQTQLQVNHLAEKALDCIYLLWQTTCEEKYLHEAFVYFEKSKSDWLRTSAREWLARDYVGIPKELVELEFGLKTQVQFYQNLRRKQLVMLNAGDDFKIGIWQDRFIQAKRQLDTLLQNIERDYPEYYRLKYDYRVTSLKEIISYAQANDIELVNFFWGKESLYTMSISSNEIKWQKETDVNCLENSIAMFQKAIDSEDIEWATDHSRLASFQTFLTSGSNLYNLLLAPVLNTTSKNKLILVPDGPLGQLPFQALVSTNPVDSTFEEINYRNLPYLVRQRPIQYQYSATLLLQQRDRQSYPQDYIGFAPTYGKETGVTASSRKTYLPTVKSNLTRPDFNKLIYAQQEIEETIAQVGGKKIMGKDATEQSFKQIAGEARIVHLAGHAFTHESEPDYSALIFSKDPSCTDDGELYAHELYNLPFRADLAVLSACNTGAGITRKGEGVMSLSRAFQYAGCSSVVMSLWSANDVTTKTIIVDFFGHLKTNSSKSKALQKATMDFLSDIKTDRLTHPFYWANFVLVGQDNPIEFQVAGNPYKPWLIVSLMIGLLIMIGRVKKMYLHGSLF